jgi:hypothetical protein
MQLIGLGNEIQPHKSYNLSLEASRTACHKPACSALMSCLNDAGSVIIDWHAELLHAVFRSAHHDDQ